MATVWEEQLESADVSEAHWSTSTILAIFMAACLVSAVFFGMGYSFGRGGTAKPVFLATASKAAGIPASPVQRPLTQAPVRPALREVAVVATPSSSTVNRSATQDAHPTLPVLQTAPIAPAQHATAVAARVRKAAHPLQQEHSARKVEQSNASTATHYMVQVGAVGDRRDARMLVSQLRKRGFHAGIYSAKHDRFLHVQIGPFADVQQAQIMRHHVMASGYRAILKHAS